MLRILFLSGFCFTCSLLLAQEKASKQSTDTVQARMVLIGDAGALIEGRPSVLNSIKKYFPLDQKTTVVFLGDNLYDYGLPDETYRSYVEIKAALDSEINLINGTKARGIMIPGNHDWANGTSQGYENVVRQGKYVDRFSDKNMNYYPKDGCPGPVEIAISNNAVLVVMDSQWWIHTKDKPAIESDCDTKTEEEVINELKDILNKNYNKLVLLATHHPFKSNGPHGGYYTLKQHIFPFTDLRPNLYIPLPLIGSVYPITRSVFGSEQDISHPKYANMINKIMGAVKTHPNVIMLAGHEHNLQYIKDSSYNYIVSGSGCKTNRVSPGRKAEYSKQALGFATLEIYNNKTVGLNFYIVDETRNDSLKHDFSEKILDFSKLPVPPSKDTVTPTFVYKDFVVAPASTHYQKAKGFQKIFSGTNHRKEWSEPISMKVFNINKEKGGFTIEGMGGGNQTKSLKLKDKKGDDWSLRTIDKDPEKAIPENFRNTFASNIVRDMISAAQPYAPMSMPVLEQAAGMYSAPKEFFFVPDDPALGYYRTAFANKICMLERKEANYRDDNKSTFKLINKMREDNTITVDQNAVLNARLLDILIADWDRHFDQWRWGKKDTGQGKMYYPIPKDRDQAFFRSDGLIVKLLGNQMPFLQGFTYEMKKLDKINFVSRDFDRMFLSSIDRKTWDSIATAFVNKITDDVIDSAIKKLPAEIYAISGKKTAETLKHRRIQLHDRAMGYYEFISKTVTITGSNENELYKMHNDNDGNLVLTGYSYPAGKQDSSFITYKRVFKKGETKEIRVFGFNGDDKFVLDSSVKSPIRLRFVGGKGNDSFIIKGRARVYAYDLASEKNSTNGKIKKYFFDDPSVNDYQLRWYQYDQSNYPRIILGYNADDGFLMGTGFSFKSYKFRREPYAYEHKFTSTFAVLRKAVQLKYSGEFNKIIRHQYDIKVNAFLNMPGITNFFGLGNNTTIDKNIERKYYFARYKLAQAEVLVRKTKEGLLNVFAGPVITHYWNRKENNIDRVLDKPSAIGLDSSAVYQKQTFAGVKAGIDINNLNNELFPGRGISWLSYAQWQKGFSNAATSFLKLESNMVVYASLKIPARVTGVIKIGGGKLITDSLQFFQALTLGQDNNLRGFRKNRFAGDGYAYGSLELRVKVFEGKSYLFPGQAGFVVFNDVGRVWLKGEQSSKWHYAFGGGLYYVPFNTAILSATIGKSEDGTIFNISFGKTLNITF